MGDQHEGGASAWIVLANEEDDRVFTERIAGDGWIFSARRICLVEITHPERSRFGHPGVTRLAHFSPRSRGLRSEVGWLRRNFGAAHGLYSVTALSFASVVATIDLRYAPEFWSFNRGSVSAQLDTIVEHYRGGAIDALR